MTFYHDTRSEAYRDPVGAVPCGQRVRLAVRAEGLRNVTLRVWWQEAETKYAMTPVGDNLYIYELTAPDAAGLLWYYFVAEDDGGAIFLGAASDGLGGAGEVRRGEPPSFQMTVYDAAFQTPEWMRDGVMMQIMVDRFCASKAPDRRKLPTGAYYHRSWNEDPVLALEGRSGEYCASDFFGGDLKGIRQKLDFLAEMGVTVLYLNPIFESDTNHKYNTGDYRKIDPSFGTEADFRSLCKAAKSKGIRVLLDGVFSHTGSNSVYFNKNRCYGDGGAYNDPSSPYAKWYRFGQTRDDYDAWWGFQTLPNVNEDEPSYRDFIINDEDSVEAHWLNAGASGWRLDVADELPMDFLRAFRAKEKAVNPDAALIGEVWEDPSNKVAYDEIRCYCAGDTLDSAMNYPLREAVLGFFTGKIDAWNFVRRVEWMQESQPAPFFYSEMNLLGSHDRPRALTVLAGIENLEPPRLLRKAFDLTDEQYELGRKRLIAAWNLICALPGMPCIYYGDDAGLYGMTDPFCRGTYPWGREDTFLQDAFREAAQRRRRIDALRRGKMAIRAVNADTVVVERFIEHRCDVFGKEAADGRCTLTISRSDASVRWQEA